MLERMASVSGLAELVRVVILRGEIGLGELIVEPPLAERFKVGRATLREALRRLEGEGLVVSRDSGVMRVVDMDQEMLVATVQARAALEGLSAGLAARRITEGRTSRGAVRAVETLADHAEAVARTEAPERALLADRSFHRAVDELAANGASRAALDGMWDRLILAAVHLVGPPAAAFVAQDHAPLLGAIAAGHASDAAELARGHVLAALA